jgi:hypothetical protein
VEDYKVIYYLLDHNSLSSKVFINYIYSIRYNNLSYIYNMISILRLATDNNNFRRVKKDGY